MSSAVRSFTKIYKRNFEISWNFYKKSFIHAFKAGLNAKKFATFWISPKRIYHSFVLQMTRNTIKKSICYNRFSYNCWFSHDVTEIQTKNLSILPRFYFHDVLEQLKTNFHTNFRFKRVLGFVLEYAWISKLLRDAAFTWRPRELYVM